VGDAGKSGHRDFGPGKPIADPAGPVLQPDESSVLAASGRIDFDVHEAISIQQIVAAAQQRRGAPADAEISIDEQDVTPQTWLRKIAEHRSDCSNRAA
jgi:hypothetical protein